MEYLIAFFIAVIVSGGLIPTLIRHAPQLGMLDAPGERKVHATVIPRCGGVAIAAGSILSALVLLPVNSLYDSIIVGGFIIILFGVADDIFEINYKWKFLGQILAICYVLSQGVYIKIVPFMGINEAPLLISYLLTILFVVGSTNAVNLSDGLDGLAAGIMLLSLVCIALFAFYSGGIEVGVIAIGLMGGIVGFLRFNTHPANIFMGDTGSQFIGFVTAVLAILLTQHVSIAYNPALPLLIMGLPILDTISVMTQRIRSGGSPFSPDKRHIHHKLLRYGLSHEGSVVVIYILQAVFLISAFWLRYSADWEVVGFYVLVSAVVLFTFYIAGQRKWVHQSIVTVEDRRRDILRKYPWLYSFCGKYIEYSIISYFVFLLACLLFVFQPVWYLEFTFFLFATFVIKWVPLKLQYNLIRIGVYGSVLAFCYSLAKFSQVILNAVDLFFFLLMLITTVAIVVTRKSTFKLTTQDMLVLLIVLAAVFFIDTEYVIRTLLYLFCLGYALEYLFHREAYLFKSLRILTFFSVLIFSTFLYIS